MDFLIGDGGGDEGDGFDDDHYHYLMHWWSLHHLLSPMTRKRWCSRGGRLVRIVTLPPDEWQRSGQWSGQQECNRGLWTLLNLHSSRCQRKTWLPSVISIIYIDFLVFQTLFDIGFLFEHGSNSNCRRRKGTEWNACIFVSVLELSPSLIDWQTVKCSVKSGQVVKLRKVSARLKKKDLPSLH